MGITIALDLLPGVLLVQPGMLWAFLAAMLGLLPSSQPTTTPRAFTAAQLLVRQPQLPPFLPWSFLWTLSSRS